MQGKITSLWIALTLPIGCSVPMAAQTAPGGLPLPIAAPAPAPDFDYAGDKGPGFWSKINAACAGSHQSPVDLARSVPDSTLQPLNLSVDETSFTLENIDKTIKVKPNPEESTRNMLVADGTAYTLVNFHFHTLSEHVFDGKHTGMELHAVFEGPNDQFKVIAVFYHLGAQSSFLQKLIEAGLPQQTTSPETKVQDLNLRDVLKDLSSYYTYNGSFTIPPCSETVTWYVLKRQAEFTLNQFEAFRDTLGNDFRPRQNLNDRVIKATLR